LGAAAAGQAETGRAGRCTERRVVRGREAWRGGGCSRASDARRTQSMCRGAGGGVRRGAEGVRRGAGAFCALQTICSCV
jgi:hypothetical protein